MKQWTLEQVSKAHDYHNVTKSNIHENFANWISSTFVNQPVVIDVGGGNGRAFLHLEKYVQKYLCIDINKKSINIGKEFFSNNEKVDFQLVDVEDKDAISKFFCDVMYFDSTLTMLDDPWAVLLSCKQITKFVYASRTSNQPLTKKELYQWGGMNHQSWLWKFNYSDIDNFCEKHQMKFQKIDENSFVITLQ